MICGMQQVCRTVRLVRRGGTEDLTFAKVLETAEIAERETKDAQNSCRVSQNRNKTEEVHQVAAPPRRGRPSGLGACNSTVQVQKQSLQILQEMGAH